jgi:hypothetical protein
MLARWEDTLVEEYRASRDLTKSNSLLQLMVIGNGKAFHQSFLIVFFSKNPVQDFTARLLCR